MRFFIGVLLSFSISGCASWAVKRQCNDTNWFNHGKQVAMNGQRLNEDTFLNQCKKVEADINYSELDKGFKKGMGEYCEPDTAFETGRKGQKFSKDMCDVPNFKTLLARHQQGVREYCRESNGYTAGASGEKYNYVCPSDMEKDFLPEFRKGRKSYLETLIAQKREEITRTEGEIRDLERQRSSIDRQISDLNRGDQVYIGRGGINISKKAKANETDLEMRRRDLENDKNSLNYQISQKRQALATYNKEIGDYRKEIAGL